VANLAGQHASEIGRTERVVPIDDPNRRKALQQLRQFFRCKRPEPAHAHKTHFLSLLAHLPDRYLYRDGERSHSHENDIRIVSHVLFEERIPIGASKDALEIGVGFLDYAMSPLHAP